MPPSRRVNRSNFAFRLARWVFFAVVLALLPIAANALGAVTRADDTLEYDALFSHGELLLVATAALGAALSELFDARHTGMRNAKLFVGWFAGLVMLASSMWFADIAAGLRDGSELDERSITDGSLVVFGLSLLSGGFCLLVAELASEPR